QPIGSGLKLAEHCIAESVGLRFLLHVGVDGGKFQARTCDYGATWVSYLDRKITGNRLRGQFCREKHGYGKKGASFRGFVHGFTPRRQTLGYLYSNELAGARGVDRATCFSLRKEVNYTGRGCIMGVDTMPDVQSALLARITTDPGVRFGKPCIR